MVGDSLKDYTEWAVLAWVEEYLGSCSTRLALFDNLRLDIHPISSLFYC